MLLEVNDDLVYEISTVVSEVLKEFQKVMPPELPHELPSRWVIDYQIELMLGYKPPVRVPYQVAPLELV